MLLELRIIHDAAESAVEAVLPAVVLSDGDPAEVEGRLHGTR